MLIMRSFGINQSLVIQAKTNIGFVLSEKKEVELRARDFFLLI